MCRTLLDIPLRDRIYRMTAFVSSQIMIFTACEQSKIWGAISSSKFGYNLLSLNLRIQLFSSKNKFSDPI